MQIKKINIRTLNQHPRYETYLRKFPAVGCYKNLKNVLSKKGFLLLSKTQPISVFANTAQSDHAPSYQIISGLRTYWAAENLKIKDLDVIFYDQEELKSANSVNEMIDADIFLSIMPFLQHNGFVRDYIKLSKLLPTRSIQSWFGVPQNKNFLKTILPFSKSLIQKYLKND